MRCDRVSKVSPAPSGASMTSFPSSTARSPVGNVISGKYRAIGLPPRDCR